MNSNIVEEVLEEIDTIDGSMNKINYINKCMTQNLLAIYDAVTQINLDKRESYETVKKLVSKQKCYEQLRTSLAVDNCVNKEALFKR